MDSLDVPRSSHRSADSVGGRGHNQFSDLPGMTVGKRPAVSPGKRTRHSGFGPDLRRGACSGGRNGPHDCPPNAITEALRGGVRDAR